MPSTSYHVVIDATADRLSDRQLAWFTMVFPEWSVDDIRRLCRESRAAGLDCIPNPDCDNRRAGGGCAGHEEIDPSAIHAAYAEGC